MERWKAILLLLVVLVCFIVAGIIEEPYEYYRVMVMK